VTLVPIPVYPWPLQIEREALIRAAKASLNADVQIRLVEFIPGSPVRVLAFGARPPHVTRWAPIRLENVDSVGSIAAALSFILDELRSEESDRWDEAAWLSEVMQCDVRFSHIEEEGKVTFA
jgi:hypothetical protein